MCWPVFWILFWKFWRVRLDAVFNPVAVDQVLIVNTIMFDSEVSADLMETCPFSCTNVAKMSIAFDTALSSTARFIVSRNRSRRPTASSSRLLSHGYNTSGRRGRIWNR